MFTDPTNGVEPNACYSTIFSTWDDDFCIFMSPWVVSNYKDRRSLTSEPPAAIIHPEQSQRGSRTGNVLEMHLAGR